MPLLELLYDGFYVLAINHETRLWLFRNKNDNAIYLSRQFEANGHTLFIMPEIIGVDMGISK